LPGPAKALNRAPGSGKNIQGKAPQPVLVSPQAAAELGSDAVILSTRQASLHPVRVRVAGVITSTPALPAGGAFVIMPLAAIKPAVTPPEPIPVNEMLLTGGS
jgi:hypothetical protein